MGVDISYHFRFEIYEMSDTNNHSIFCIVSIAIGFYGTNKLLIIELLGYYH